MTKTALKLPVKGMVHIRDVKNVGNDKYHIDRYVRYAGRIFRIRFHNSNGTPCGYDNKHCASILDQNTGAWNNVIDKDYVIAVAGNGEINTADYYGRNRQMWATNFVEAAQKAIEELFKPEK